MVTPPMIVPLSFPKFAAVYLPMLAVTATADAAALYPPPIILDLGGIEIPVVRCLLGMLGIFAARPLARKKEQALPLSQFLLVSAVMLLMVELWIVESRPGWLFAFVVALGLGFAGYSLIELLGDQIKDLVKAAFDTARGSVRSLLGSKSSKDNKDDL